MGGLFVSAAGMLAGSAEIDVLASDVANVDTPGFEAELPVPADIAPQDGYPALLVPASPAPAGGATAVSPTPDVLEAGGVDPGEVEVDGAEGSLSSTGQSMDVAILGSGWFPVGLPGGGVGYTRVGHFALDGDGTVVDAQGDPLLDAAGQPIQVPAGASDVAFTPQGEVTAEIGGQVRALAQIRVVMPANPQGMIQAQGGLWTATAAAGTLSGVTPGAAGAPGLQPGALEGSNVDLASTLVAVMSAQNAYAANGRAFSVGLQMWTDANDILG